MANEDTLQGVRTATESTDTTAANIDAAQGNWPNLESGQDTVAASGTAEALNGGTSLAVPDGATVDIAALPGNGGNVYVGDSTVTTSSGRVLAAGDETQLQVTDVASIYIDVDTASEGVSWIVESE